MRHQLRRRRRHRSGMTPMEDNDHDLWRHGHGGHPNNNMPSKSNGYSEAAQFSSVSPATVAVHHHHDLIISKHDGCEGSSRGYDGHDHDHDHGRLFLPLSPALPPLPFADEALGDEEDDDCENDVPHDTAAFASSSRCNLHRAMEAEAEVDADAEDDSGATSRGRTRRSPGPTGPTIDLADGAGAGARRRRDIPTSRRSHGSSPSSTAAAPPGDGVVNPLRVDDDDDDCSSGEDSPARGDEESSADAAVRMAEERSMIMALEVAQWDWWLRRDTPTSNGGTGEIDDDDNDGCSHCRFCRTVMNPLLGEENVVRFGLFDRDDDHDSPPWTSGVGVDFQAQKVDGSEVSTGDDVTVAGGDGGGCSTASTVEAASQDCWDDSGGSNLVRAESDETLVLFPRWKQEEDGQPYTWKQAVSSGDDGYSDDNGEEEDGEERARNRPPSSSCRSSDDSCGCGGILHDEIPGDGSVRCPASPTRVDQSSAWERLENLVDEVRKMRTATDAVEEDAAEEKIMANLEEEREEEVAHPLWCSGDGSAKEQGGQWYAYWSDEHMREFIYQPVSNRVLWSYWSEEHEREYYVDGRTGEATWMGPLDVVRGGTVRGGCGAPE